MTPIQYIKTPNQLAKLCEQIKKEPWLALDTEFLREKTYYPKFCLLQIATPEWVACIDPIALPNLDELFEALTLIQTKRIKSFPVILMGSEYWKGLLDWLKNTMLPDGKISASDLDFVQIIDDPEEAVKHIKKYIIV